MRYFSRALFCTALLSLPAAYGKEDVPQNLIPAKIEEAQGPWFTGTLLPQSLVAIPPGYINIQPFFYFIDTFGQYDRHWHAHSAPNLFTFNPQLYLAAGLVTNIDFSISPMAIYNHKQGKSSWHFADLPAGFDFQVLAEQADRWWPTITLFLGETFPTGKYQKLNPRKKGTDISGGGAWDSTFSIAVSHFYHIGGIYCAYPYINVQYTVPSRVHVRGFNTYGGGFGTNGTVKPGNFISLIFGGEISLAKHWNFGLDVASFFADKTTFSGKKGVDETGVPAVVGLPSSTQITLAPIIEYSFNETFSIVAGSWFSVAGRNAPQFASGVLSFYWYFDASKKSSPQAPGPVKKARHARY